MTLDVGGRIAVRLANAGCAVPGDVIDAVATYYELLLRWNRTVNLTALRDDEEAIDRLIVEPLVAGQSLPGGGVLIDVGSGGGSPAIPLKLVRPAMTLLMVESRTRKCAFLREAARVLALSGVRVVARRFEDMAADGTAGEPAAVISVRAVRLDVSLLRSMALVSNADTRLWVFGGGASEVVSAGWVVEASRPLVPGRRSVLWTYRRS